MAEGGFSPEEWAAKHNLNRNTTRLLRREELLDEEVLKALTREDINRLELSIGQARALTSAVADLGNPIQVDQDGEDQVANDQEQEDVGQEAAQLDLLVKAGRELDHLLAQGGEGATKSAKGGAAPYHQYDPRMNLTVRAVTKKALQVVSFLPEAARTRVNRRKRDRLVLAESPGGTVSLKTEDAGQVYISWDEWSAANNRLLAHMLREGDLPRVDVEYYLAYLTYIYELVPNFEWTSILEYDTRYREIQAQHGFPWGTMAPHLDTILVAKKPVAALKGKPAGGDRGRIRQEEKKQICKMFATRGSCPFGEACKYRHERGAAPLPKKD